LIEGDTRSRPSIYNCYEFPTAVVHGYTRSAAAREVGAGEDARPTLPEGAGGNPCASRFHEGSIGKETPVGVCLPCRFLSYKVIL
jgi:hypothetical protein